MDLKTLTDEELNNLKFDIGRELERRAVLQQAPVQAERISLTFITARDAEQSNPEGVPPTWIQPTGAHDAYPPGYYVSHNGKIYNNITPNNVWEPGVSGWREIVPDGQVPAWVQPTGAHDAYSAGDKVTHNGKTWQSNVNANVWEPPEQWSEYLDEQPTEPVEPPVEEPEIIPWESGRVAIIGTLMTYEGTTYECLQGHTTQEGWEPPNAPSLWTPTEITPPDEPEPSVPEWSAQATYAPGDRVQRDGVIYECLVGHGPEYQGTWGPPQASVWSQIGPVGSGSVV